MPPSKKDAVHRYFKYEEQTNTNTCLLCQNKLKGRHTTNLKNHLAAKHLDEYQVIADLNSKNTDNTRKSNTNHSAATVEIIKKLCVRLVTVHGRPLSMMEDEAFQDIINLVTTDSGVSRNINIKAIKTKINQEAIEIRRKIFQEVKNQMISLKLDAATCQERKFIGINIQYIKDSKIIVRNLAVQEVYERQTATFLKKVVEEILLEFMISLDQIYCVCTDNGSNMLKMVKLMGGTYISNQYYSNAEYPEECIDEDEENGDENIDQEYEVSTIFNDFDFNFGNLIDSSGTFKVRGMLCAAHTLQLAVKDAMNCQVTTHAIISLAKVVVNILRKPNNANSLKQAKLRKPINDCATRWSSTYNMLARLITLKEFCDTIPEINGLVSEAFWVDVKDLLKCLEPANEATIILQKQQLTMGDFYITWLNCKNKISTIDHPFANALLRSMEQRENKLLQNDVVLESLYIDGRLNVLLSEEQCQKARMLLTEVHHQLNRLKDRNRIPDLERPDYDDESIQIIDSVVNPSPSTSSTEINLSAVEDMLRNSERARGNVTQLRSFDVCLYELCAAPRVNINQDIISHWHNKAVAFSEIAAVSMVVLGAPATQVSVERLFSSLKYILHPLRTNLSPLFLRDLMLVRSNKDLI